MAQRTEKEETDFKVPETIIPCVNNCGFTGNPATNNMCQKCFNATTSAAAAVSSSSSSSSASSAAGVSAPSKFVDDKSSRSTASRSPKRSYPSDDSTQTTDRANTDELAPSEAKRVVNRCSGCRRKVGLTGFRCRCGELFCAEHRYSDRHDCSYDYKAAGREAIARENPVVKAPKIVSV